MTLKEAAPAGINEYVYCAVRFGWWPKPVRRVIRYLPPIHYMIERLWLNGHTWDKHMFQKQLAEL